MDLKRILIVDDIFSNRLLLSSALETLGINSKAVNDGQAAINALEEEDFSLVFMDIEMPVMNGLETVIYIRKQMLVPVKNMPVIALTAHNLSEYGHEIEKAGFTEVLTKPYSLEKLQNVIDKYLK